MLIVSHLKAGGKFTPGRRVLDSLDGGGELARNLIELHTTADSLDVRYLYEPGKDASGNELPRDLDKDVVAERDLILVPLSEEAAVFWDRLQVNISEFKGLVANGESMFPKYYLAFGRAGMIAHRIASIMAVLEYGGGYDRDGVVRELRVELHQFKYAIGYVLTVLGGMVSDFDTGEPVPQAQTCLRLAFALSRIVRGRRLGKRLLRVVGQRVGKGRLVGAGRDI